MEDPTPAPPAERAPAAGPDILLWLGVLVIVCALIVLVLQRRRAAASSAPLLDRSSTKPPAPIAQADGYAEVEDLVLDREIEALTSQAVRELSTEGAIAPGAVHSHKRLRRHPELAATNGSVRDADV